MNKMTEDNPLKRGISHNDDQKWWPFMTGEELKKKYDGKICSVCGKAFRYQVKKNKDGSESVYPHGIWASRKQWVNRNWFWVLLTPILFPVYIVIGVYVLYANR